MKKRKVFNLGVVFLIALSCFVSGSWLGSRGKYAKGRLEEQKATLPFQLFMYLQLYDFRKHVDLQENPVPKNLVNPINTMLFVNTALSFYEKYQQEYDQGRWTQTQMFRDNIERARKIREEANEALLKQNIAATNLVVDQTIQQSLEPATNSSSRTVEAETID